MQYRNQRKRYPIDKAPIVCIYSYFIIWANIVEQYFADYCKNNTKRRGKAKQIGLNLIEFMEINILHEIHISDKQEICIANGIYYQQNGEIL